MVLSTELWYYKESSKWIFNIVAPIIIEVTKISNQTRKIARFTDEGRRVETAVSQFNNTILASLATVMVWTFN